MLNNSSAKHERSNLSRAITIGATAGGLIGAALGILFNYGLLFVPLVSSILIAVPLSPIITGTVIGIVMGVIIGGFVSFFSTSNKEDKNSDYTDSGRLELREERLDITKNRVQTAEVNMHKESFTEEKTFTVPVTREELVIEKKDLKNDETETIRIPVKEERVEIKKHPVILNDVSYHIEQFQENKCVEEVLKKETLKIDHEGSTTVIDKEVKNPDLF